MDAFRTPDERFAELPGFPYEPNYAEVDGLRLHHVDEGEGPAVLCFHGEPSWSYLYRHMTDRLVGAGHRVVCPDLAGFGRSDKPTDPDWYTYERHVETVTRRGEMPKPLTADSTSMARATLDRLWSGSPMPMNTSVSSPGWRGPSACTTAST